MVDPNITPTQRIASGPDDAIGRLGPVELDDDDEEPSDVDPVPSLELGGIDPESEFDPESEYAVGSI